jgi:molybdopterin-containing oxidoreductase family membrane subunit
MKHCREKSERRKEAMGVRRNWEMVYKPQREWGWPIAIEIFCGGTAGGTYIISVLSYLLFGGRIFLAGVLASLVLMLISVFVLITDSTSVWRISKAFLNIRSPLTVGAISLSLFTIFSIATVGIILTGVAPGALRVVGWLGVAVSLIIIIYPGALMGLMRAIPFWYGAGLPLIFLSGALLSGSAVVTLVGGLGYVNFDLSRMTLWQLVVYGVFLLVYIIMGGQGSRAAQISVHELIKGNLFPIFVIGGIAIGLVVPLAVYIMGIPSSSAPMFQIGSVLILIGGILMRYSLIASGVRMSMLSEDSITATYWLYH